MSTKNEPKKNLIIFHCSKCLFSTDSRKIYDRHMITLHNIAKVLCPECQVICSNNDELFLHRMTHRQEFRCEKCPFATFNLCIWTVHHISHQPQPISLENFQLLETPNVPENLHPENSQLSQSSESPESSAHWIPEPLEIPAVLINSSLFLNEPLPELFPEILNTL